MPDRGVFTCHVSSMGASSLLGCSSNDMRTISFGTSVLSGVLFIIMNFSFHFPSCAL